MQTITLLTDEMIDNMSYQEYLNYIGMTEEQYEAWVDKLEADGLVETEWVETPNT
jgi:DNA-binding PadR family transcriptional regulator